MSTRRTGEMDFVILVVDPSQINPDDLTQFKKNEKVAIVRIRRMAYGRHAPLQAISAQGSREMSLDDLREFLSGLDTP